MTTVEDDVLARYSTPGLRKNTLDRTAKKESLLGSLGRLYPREDIEQILDQLYPPAPPKENP